MHHEGRAGEVLSAVRSESPLVHNITNYVSMDIAANALLAVGASPVMAHALQEVEDIVGISRVLVINIGTLSPVWVDAMHAAARRAGSGGKRWVLDPVGVGATSYRDTTAASLLALGPTAVRGNASEILALAGAAATTKGVDSAHGSGEARDTAVRLARDSQCVVGVTGATDYITDGERMLAVENGVAGMSRITALGCSTSALVGAFLAVHGDVLEATAYAISFMGLAGERAAERAEGPASLRTGILDALHTITPGDFEAGARISEAAVRN